ncbi:MAG: hypothetical protein FWG73_03220 [Planctomycetaceae bacterium]|nr:hypothetical protein [Planctomycetaceae bacterium]
MVRTQVVEQTSERSESRGAATVVRDVARAAIIDEVARTTVKRCIAGGASVKRIAGSRGKQVSQTTAHSESGCAANLIAGVADGKYVIAWIAGDNRVARIAVVRSDAVDQPFQTGKEIAAAFGNKVIACSARGYACRIARIRKPLNSQH